MQDPFNLSDAEFDAVMTEIDSGLRQRSDRIPGREMLGLADFCAKFQITLHNTHPTTRRIMDWFGRMYGERLAIDWDFGRSVVLVKGEICKIRGMLFFGSMPIICSPGLTGIKLQQETPHGPIKVYNLAEDDQVRGLTSDMAKRLSPDECAAIVRAYGRMFLAFSRMQFALGKRYRGTDAPFIQEAIHDLLISTDSLLAAPPNYGGSKWASLQAVEKLIKSCIREKKVTPKKSHDLAGLCATAVAVGVPTVAPALIATIQCDPSVRYDSALVSKLEAVEAHYAALTICSDLAPVVKRTTAQSDSFDYQFHIASGAIPGLVLGHKSGAPPFKASDGRPRNLG
jgi:hypothetical protein